MSDKLPGRPARLLFLSEWFDPEPCYKGLRFALALADQGFGVEVATAFPNYGSGRIYDGYRLRPYQRETLAGIPVHRLYVYPSHDRSSARRMLTYCSFFLSALAFLLLRMRRYDALYVYHPPIMPGLAAALASLIHRRPFILEIQDLWPDSVASSGMGSSRLAGILNRLCNFTYRRAARIICQSKGMAETLAQRGVPREKLTTIYNWSNYVPAADDPSGAAFPPELEPAFEGRINFVYGGNLGQAQALEHVVEAAALASREVPELRVHLIGQGMERDRIAAMAEQLAPGTVLVHDAVPPRVMDRIFDRADALVMNLKDDPLYDITIPSKAQHYLSVGKPIIAGISGEAAGLLEESGAARVVRNGDAAVLAEAMTAAVRKGAAERERVGLAGRDYYATKMSFGAAIAKTVSSVELLSGSRS